MAKRQPTSGEERAGENNLMARVLDTDVFSIIFKESSFALDYKEHTKNQFLIVSFVTLAELEQWAIRANWGTRKRDEFERYLRRHYIQHSTRNVCRLWAKVRDDGRASGINIFRRTMLS